MPALSQNLIFHVTNGNTTTVSTQVVYPNSATNALIYSSDKIQGDGYFGNSDGFHTVFWSVANFVGNISVQGTLASEPQEADWVNVKLIPPSNNYSVDTTGLARAGGVTSTSYTSLTTTIDSYNFSGNFVWLRGRISGFTEGVVNGISINR
jgi:hypothetical protein